MKYKILKKGYQVDFRQIEEGYCASEVVCHADTIGKAKSTLLKDIMYEGWKPIGSDKEVTYLTIPVKRYPEIDILEFEGKPTKQYQIEFILRKREREQHLDGLFNSDTEYFYITKNGMYYKDNSVGYTNYNHRAGVYPKEEAIDHARFCDELHLIPIDIDVHNIMMNDEILLLQSRLIKKDLVV